MLSVKTQKSNNYSTTERADQASFPGVTAGWFQRNMIDNIPGFQFFWDLFTNGFSHETMTGFQSAQQKAFRLSTNSSNPYAQKGQRNKSKKSFEEKMQEAVGKRKQRGELGKAWKCIEVSKVFSASQNIPPRLRFYPHITLHSRRTWTILCDGWKGRSSITSQSICLRYSPPKPGHHRNRMLDDGSRYEVQQQHLEAEEWMLQCITCKFRTCPARRRT